MGGEYFKLAVPLIVFIVLLIDIDRQLDTYTNDGKNIKKFKFARVLIIIALIISLILGIFDILGRPLGERLAYYSKLFNVIVLITYLIFTRFKRN